MPRHRASRCQSKQSPAARYSADTRAKTRLCQYTATGQAAACHIVLRNSIRHGSKLTDPAPSIFNSDGARRSAKQTQGRTIPRGCKHPARLCRYQDTEQAPARPNSLQPPDPARTHVQRHGSVNVQRQSKLLLVTQCSATAFGTGASSQIRRRRYSTATGHAAQPDRLRAARSIAAASILPGSVDAKTQSKLPPVQCTPYTRVCELYKQ